MIFLNGNIIKSKIYKKNMTINEVANLLNINSMTLSNWINGRNTKQIDNFINLLILLDIDIRELKKD